MPLDGHNYLVSQGWSGKGTGLRQGAIIRPIAIPQKKNLAGLGKDRDEAFPFWDHLFTAASKSIKVKLASDDESNEEISPLHDIKRTVTGIMSNRRPVTGASATTSGTSDSDTSDRNPRLNLVAIAKRDAARVNLYAKFFRGPILGPDDDALSPARLVEPRGDIKDGQTKQELVKTNDQKKSEKVVESSPRKRKRDLEDVAARSQRKKERKEQKSKEKEERRAWQREQRVNEQNEGNIAPEDPGEKKKRWKRELREKEKSKGDRGTDQVTKEQGKKKKKTRKGGSTAADIPLETTLEGGEYASIDISTSTLDPDASEPTPAGRQSSHEAHERKKKRKREKA